MSSASGKILLGQRVASKIKSVNLSSATLNCFSRDFPKKDKEKGPMVSNEIVQTSFEKPN